MASERRIERVQTLLVEAVSDILARDFQFDEMVTVTRAEPSRDLYYARVFVSIFTDNAAREKEILELLKRAASDIQFSLNRKLRMRPVPRITFAVDRDEKRRERIERLLAEEKKRLPPEN